MSGLWFKFFSALMWVVVGIGASLLMYWLLNGIAIIFPKVLRAVIGFVFGVVIASLVRLPGMLLRLLGKLFRVLPGTGLKSFAARLDSFAGAFNRLADKVALYGDRLKYAVRHSERGIKPYLYILPAYFAIAVFLFYPAVLTVYNSFRDKLSKENVGLKNYQWLWESNTFRTTLFNTVLWIIIVPVASVVVGLIVATLADRLTKRWENVSKSVIFLPMAVSLVGASTMWRYVYGFTPKGQPQTGMLNAAVVAFGGDPVPWFQQTQFHLNSLLLMVILLWSQAGFSMVLLSAAIKGVPEDTLEAARIDGASPRQSFFKIVLPQIRGTIVTLLVTGAIGVMKIFDIVHVTTRGRYKTDVIGRLFWDMFSAPNYGRSSAIVVVLLIAVIPIMIFQIRDFRRGESLA